MEEELFDNLTLNQKIALTGEVADLLKPSTSDASALFRLYYAIKHIPSDIAVPFVAIARELVLLPKEKIDKVLLYISAHEFPEWLWLEKVVSDIRVALSTCCQEQTSVPVHLDVKAIRQALVKSAFVRFMRNCAMLSKDEAIKACNAVLAENDLEFLADSCLSLKEEMSDLKELNQKIDLDSLFKIELDCKMGLMSYVEETKMLKKLLLLEEDPKQFMREMENEKSKIVWTGEPNVGVVEELEGSPNMDVLSAALDQMEGILKSARAQMQEKKETKNVTYVVSKAFKGRSELSPLKEFKTADEAKEFIKNLETQYPELLTTCDFIISEKNNGRKEV